MTPLATDAPTLAETVDAGRLQGALAGAGHGLVEQAGDWATEPDRLAPFVRSGGIAVSLTTATAFGLDLAEILANCAIAAWPDYASRRADLEFCLHEAIANGLMHGNLGVGVPAGGGPDDFMAYSRTLEARLADPELSRLRLRVFLCIFYGSLQAVVVDQGAGYTPPGPKPDATNSSGKSGRGLGMIRDLADDVDIADGGRELRMRFSA